MTPHRLAVLALVLVAATPAVAQSQTLDELLVVARRNAPALQASAAGVERAEQAIREARAARAATLDLTASVVQNSEEPRMVLAFPGRPQRQTVVLGRANAVDVRADAALPLYTGGRQAALVAAARAARDGERRSHEQTEADLVWRVSQAFYRAIASRRAADSVVRPSK